AAFCALGVRAFTNLYSGNMPAAWAIGTVKIGTNSNSSSREEKPVCSSRARRGVAVSAASEPHWCSGRELHQLFRDLTARTSARLGHVQQLIVATQHRTYGQRFCYALPAQVPSASPQP